MQQSTSTRAAVVPRSPAADDNNDTDDESYDTAAAAATPSFTATTTTTVALDSDVDAQIEALEEDIVVGTSNSVQRSENERAVRLTMELIRTSARSAAATERAHATAAKHITATDDDDAEIDALLQRKVLRLDWLNIGRIENLDAFTHVHELYLQHNLLQRIEHLECLTHLTFLALGGNRIERIEGLQHLTNLKFLDLSNNCIDEFVIHALPQSLQIVRFAANPFVKHMPAYVHLVFERLSHVVQVDQFRRAGALTPTRESQQERSVTENTTNSSSNSRVVYSPRSRDVELEMEVEQSQSVLARAAAAAAVATDDTPEGDVLLLDAFSLDAYKAQRNERLQVYQTQRAAIDATRHAALVSSSRPHNDDEEEEEGYEKSEAPSDAVSAAMTALHATALARARASTKAAIADARSHVEQMEIEHKAWQQQMLSSS